MRQSARVQITCAKTGLARQTCSLCTYVGTRGTMHSKAGQAKSGKCILWGSSPLLRHQKRNDQKSQTDGISNIYFAFASPDIFLYTKSYIKSEEMTVRCVMIMGLRKGNDFFLLGLSSVACTEAKHTARLQKPHPAQASRQADSTEAFGHNNRNKNTQRAMIRRNSGARRPVSGGPSNSVVDRPAAAAAAPQAPVVPPPPPPPRRRRSSGASSRSSSSRGQHSSRSQHASLPPSGRRVAFKNETRVRIVHSWRDMSEREWCSTWVTVSLDASPACDL